MPYELKKVSPRLYEVFNSETGKIHAKHSSLKNAKAQMRLLHMIGGAVSGKEVKKFVSASYEKGKGDTKKIGNYKLDKSLSSNKVKVYANPEGKAIIANRGTTGTASDWSNNLIYGTLGADAYKKTDRYKQAKKTQKAVLDKYGKENTTNIAHSQSGIIARELNKEGLVNKSIMVNPASKGEKVKKNEQVIKSSLDPVSVLVPTSKQKGKVNVIKAKSFNPLAQHSADIIRKKDASKMFGLGELIHIDINSHNGKNYKMEGGGFVPHYYQLEEIPRRYM